MIAQSNEELLQSHIETGRSLLGRLENALDAAQDLARCPEAENEILALHAKFQYAQDEFYIGLMTVNQKLKVLTLGAPTPEIPDLI